jgi:putative FmdB family regulatory protein
MPAYDFKCTKCETEFEVERPFGATGSVKCPSCGSLKTEKIFSAAGVVFKGSGFYLTDSRSSASKSSGSESKGKGEEIKPAADSGKSTAGGDGDSGSRSESKDEKSSTDAAKPGKKAKT